jgi:serine/threonine protein kinase
MSRKAFDPDLLAVVRQITDRFIMSREGTPIHKAKSELAKKHSLLDEAERNRYVQKIGPNYFPAYRAMELEDNHDRSVVEQCTTLVFRALKRIYEQSGEIMCSRSNILQASRSIDPNVTPECITLGMLFATEFARLIPTWNASPDNNDLNLSLQTSPRLLEFGDLPSAWKQELRNVAPAHANIPPGQQGPAPPIFETTGNAYTSDGTAREGGTARVLRVTDSEGKRWALKCLKPDHATTTRTKRFLNELEFCRRFPHPNVVQVVDEGFVTQSGKKCPFYVMPYYPQTLRDLISKGIPHNRILPVFSTILNGVESAHLQGVWHRDLKPENVLCENDGQGLVVADFGIAHFAQEELYTLVETRQHDRLANFLYSAPEQRLRGKEVDHRADIFALGLMLNEMFTNHVPQGEDYPRIGTVAPQFAYLDEIVEKMVQHAREKRPNSIDEIKLTLTARGNEFLSRQKLDTLRRTVVPSSTVTHPLIQNPIQVEDVDIRGDTLVAILNQDPSPDWIRVFVHPRAMSYIAGTEPANWRFIGKEAGVRIGHAEGQAKQVLNNFRDYVRSANALYKEALENAARELEEAEKRGLQQRIAEEERRQRMLKNLKS